jgi:hypothetical protein
VVGAEIDAAIPDSGPAAFRKIFLRAEMKLLELL